MQKKANLKKIVVFLLLLPLSLKSMAVTFKCSDGDIAMPLNLAEKYLTIKNCLTDHANLSTPFDYSQFTTTEFQNLDDLLTKKITAKKLNNQKLVAVFKLAENLEAPKFVRKKLARQVQQLPKKQLLKLESYLRPYAISINTLIEKEGQNFFDSKYSAAGQNGSFYNTLDLSNLNLHSLEGIEKLDPYYEKNFFTRWLYNKLTGRNFQLILDDNQLDCIDFQELCRIFPKLRVISVKNNQFETLDLNALQSNVTIDFQNNQIKTIKPIGWLSSYPENIDLNLSNNKLSHAELKKADQAIKPQFWQRHKWKLTTAALFAGLGCYFLNSCIGNFKNAYKISNHQLMNEIDNFKTEKISEIKCEIFAENKILDENNAYLYGFLADLVEKKFNEKYPDPSIIFSIEKKLLYDELLKEGAGNIEHGFKSFLCSTASICGAVSILDNCKNPALASKLTATNQKSIKKKKRNELNMKEVNDSPKTAEDLD